MSTACSELVHPLQVERFLIMNADNFINPFWGKGNGFFSPFKLSLSVVLNSANLFSILPALNSSYDGMIYYQ